jgi:hypothetical protein
VTGPDYISWSEWQSRQRVVKGRVRRRSASIAAAVITVGVGIWLFPAVWALFQVKALMSSLDQVQNYRCTINAYDAQGNRYPFRTESYAGADWEVDLGSRQAVAVQKNGKTVVAEPEAALARMHTGWSGTSRFLERLKTAIEGSTNLARWGVDLLGKQGGFQGYRFTFEDERWTLWMGENPSWPHSGSVELKDYHGWYKVKDFQMEPVDKVASITALPAPLKDVRQDQSPALQRAVVATFPLGEGNGTLAAADCSADGTMFFLIKNPRSTLMQAVVSDSSGNTDYQTVLSKYVPVGSKNYQETGLDLLTVYPMYPERTTFPFTASVEVRVSGTERTLVGDFDFRFQRPTCYVLPYYRFPAAASDLPYYEFQSHAADLRADYFRYLYRDLKGKPLISSRQEPPMSRVNRQDRERALEEYWTALFYRQEGGILPTRDDEWIAATQLECYNLLKGMGRDKEAKNTAELAREAIERGGVPFGEVRGEVDTILQRESLPEIRTSH